MPPKKTKKGRKKLSRKEREAAEAEAALAQEQADAEAAAAAALAAEDPETRRKRQLAEAKARWGEERTSILAHKGAVSAHTVSNVRSIFQRTFYDLYSQPLHLDAQVGAGDVQHELGEDDVQPDGDDEVAGEDDVGVGVAVEEADPIEEEIRSIQARLEVQQAEAARVEAELHAHEVRAEEQAKALDATYIAQGVIPGVDVPRVGLAFERLPTPPGTPKDDDVVRLAKTGRDLVADMRGAAAKHRLLDLEHVIASQHMHEERMTKPKIARDPQPLPRMRSARAEAREATSRSIQEAREREIAEKRKRVIVQRAKRHAEQEAYLSTLTPHQRAAREARIKKKELTDKAQLAQMTPTELEENRRILERMQRKQQFLRNPRFARSGAAAAKALSLAITAGPLDALPTQSPAQVGIMPDPLPVLFDEFEAHETYVLTLTLHNQSAVGRRIRVIPPRTEYFSIGKLEFPGATGSSMLAPGLAARVEVFFHPDTRADFLDSISVVAENGGRVGVPLIGRRPPVRLSLDDELDVEDCLAGESKTVHFPMKNHGGAGDMVIVPAPPIGDEGHLAWTPELHQERGEDDNALELDGPFAITSAQALHLEHGDAASLSVVFSPPKLESGEVLFDYAAEFLVLFDNRTSKRFRIVGRGAEIVLRLEEIGGTPVDLDGRRPDTILFDPLAVFGATYKSIIVHNTAPLDVSFRWVVSPVHLQLGDDDDGAAQQQEEPVFRVTPPNGEFGPNERVRFDVVFEPLRTVLRRAHACLLVTDADGEERLSMDFIVQGAGVGCHLTMDPPVAVFGSPVALGSLAMQTVQLVNHSASDTKFAFDIAHGDVVEVEPESGTIDANSSLPLLVTVRRKQGVDPIEATLTCHVELGDDVKLPVVSKLVHTPSLLFRKPQVDFGVLNFGVQHVSATRPLQAFNTSTLVDCPWSVTCFMDDADVCAKGEITFERSQGSVPPDASEELSITFTPSSCGVLRARLRFDVPFSPPQFIDLRGAVQAPRVSMSPMQLDLGTCFVGVERIATVTLKNLRHLEAQVEWEDIAPDDGEPYTASFTPCKFTMKGLEERVITVRFTALRAEPGVLHPVFGCDVEGIDLPLAVRLSATLRDVRVTVHPADTLLPEQLGDLEELRNRLFEARLPVPPVLGSHAAERLVEAHEQRRRMHQEICQEMDGILGADEPVEAEPDAVPETIDCLVDELDFGAQVPIFTKQVRSFVVRNRSAIRTWFSAAPCEYVVHDLETAETILQDLDSSVAPTMRRKDVAGSTLKRNKQLTATGRAVTAAETVTLSKTRKVRSSMTSALTTLAGPIKRTSTLLQLRETSRAHSTASGGGHRTGIGLPIAVLSPEQEAVPFKSVTGRYVTAAQAMLDRQQQTLSAGQGLAFVVSPANCVLEPWDAVVVHVVCVNDLCGSYRDKIACSVHVPRPLVQISGDRGRQESVDIPASVHVIGSPLSFTHTNPGMTFPTTSAADGQQDGPTLGLAAALCVPHPSLTWAPVPSYSRRFTKLVQVSNAGPKDVKLTWHLHDWERARPLLARSVQIDLEVEQGDGHVDVAVAPFRMPEAGVDYEFAFGLEDTELVVPSRSRAAFKVWFDASDLSAQDVSAFLIADVQVRNPEWKPKRRATVTSEQPVAVVKKVKKKQKKKTALSALDAFEAKLREQRRAAGEESASDSEAEGEELEELEEEVAVQEEDEVPEWVEAPAALRDNPFLVELFATTEDAQLTIDKGERPDGSRSLRFKINPYTRAREKRLRDRKRGGSTAAPKRHGLSPYETSLVREVPVTNTSRVAMSFSVRAEPEDVFRVVGAEMPEGGEDKMLLQPGQSSAISVLFRAPPARDQSRWPLVQRHAVDGAVVIAHSNGQTQHVALEGLLYRPRLDVLGLSPRAGLGRFSLTHDFGVVHVDQVARVVVQLSNPSLSDATWKLFHVPAEHRVDELDTGRESVDSRTGLLARKPTGRAKLSTMNPRTLAALSHPEFDAELHCLDEPAAFHFSAKSGSVLAGSVPRSSAALPNGVLHSKDREPASVAIEFQPVKAGQFRCRFVLKVAHGVPAELGFMLSGQGTVGEASERRAVDNV